jgi:hypothetical protein
MANIEIYKELSAHERHFNQMQNAIRSLASTWLLATFAGFGYLVVAKGFPRSEIDLLGALVALASGTGIWLLWVLDIPVYHTLLVAMLKEMEKFENAQDFPRVRSAMSTAVVSRVGCLKLSARRKISLFYGLPVLFMATAAAILLWDGWMGVPRAIDLGIAAWLAALFVLFCIIVSANRPDGDSRSRAVCDAD